MLFSAIFHIGCSLREWILPQFNISVFRVHTETQSSIVIFVHKTFRVASTLCKMPSPSWTESGLCFKLVLDEKTHTRTHAHTHTHNVKGGQNVYVFCTQKLLKLKYISYAVQIFSVTPTLLYPVNCLPAMMLHFSDFKLCWKADRTDLNSRTSDSSNIIIADRDAL